MRGGSTEPPRIVAGELFRSVTVNFLNLVCNIPYVQPRNRNYEYPIIWTSIQKSDLKSEALQQNLST